MSSSSTAGRNRRCGRTSSSGNGGYIHCSDQRRDQHCGRAQDSLQRRRTDAIREPADREYRSRDLYLRAQRMGRNREFNELAMEMLRRAIELDPRFAEAMAELSYRNLPRVYYADTSQTQQALDWANEGDRHRSRFTPCVP